MSHKLYTNQRIEPQQIDNLRLNETLQHFIS